MCELNESINDSVCICISIYKSVCIYLYMDDELSKAGVERRSVRQKSLHITILLGHVINGGINFYMCVGGE